MTTKWNESFWNGVLGAIGVEFKVEVALGATDGQGGFSYDDPASLYDTATYSTDDLYWVDLTPRVRSVSGARGRSKLGESFRPGQGTLELDNQDGVFNPERGRNIVGDQAMRPGRIVRLSGKRTDENEDQWVPLWVMRVQALADEYVDAAHQIISKWGLVGMETILESNNPPPLEVADPATAGQTADERARYIWSTINDYTDALLITPDTYDHPMIATTFPGSVYDQMGEAAEAEGGDFYAGKEGAFYMRGRGWLDPAAEPKFLIGDYSNTDVVVLDATTAWDMTRIRNGVWLTAEGGVTQGNINSSSQAVYGKQDFRRDGLQNDNDGDVVTLVNQALDLFAFDSMRITQLSVWSPRLDGVDHLLNVELGDVIQVTVVTAAVPPWSYTIKAFVNEISHEVTHDNWVVRLRIDNTFRGDPSLGGPYSADYNQDYNALLP